MLHLEILGAALERGYTMKDARPSNVQFVGPRPTFIDLGSFARRGDGQRWTGYTQFCRTFLNPLMVQAATGVRFQPWMRASLEGILPEELARLLPLRWKLRKPVLPLGAFVLWLAGVARAGILEFVSREDPAVEEMLRWREGAHAGYTETALREALEASFGHVEAIDLRGTARRLYRFGP
ncbi:MAG: hypothetical protein HY660_06885 [Armatimonadetes bacterium]|nr:hypothetical protein [Armatimonadota bacterium]